MGDLFVHNQAGNQQKGLCNRDMIGIRVENLPDENVIAMDEYYTELLRREQESRGFQYYDVTTLQYFPICPPLCYCRASKLCTLDELGFGVVRAYQVKRLV